MITDLNSNTTASSREVTLKVQLVPTDILKLTKESKV